MLAKACSIIDTENTRHQMNLARTQADLTKSSYRNIFTLNTQLHTDDAFAYLIRCCPVSDSAELLTSTCVLFRCCPTLPSSVRVASATWCDSASARCTRRTRDSTRVSCPTTPDAPPPGPVSSSMVSTIYAREVQSTHVDVTSIYARRAVRVIEL